MNIQERKSVVIEKIKGLSEDQLSILEEMLEENNRLDEALDEALSQVLRGQVTPHSQVKRKYQKWL